MNLSLGNIIKRKSVTAIEVVLQSASEFRLNVICLEKKKSRVSIIKQREGLGSAEELEEFLNTANAVVLLFSGKGIIHKKITSINSTATKELLAQVLPNANEEEFSVQLTPIANTDDAFVSVLRKSLINDVLNVLSNVGITNIVGAALAPFSVNQALPLLSKALPENAPIVMAAYELTIANKQITTLDYAQNYEAAATFVMIGDEQLSLNLLPLYGLAITYYTNQDALSIQNDAISKVIEESFEKRKFEVLGWSLLVSTFLILFINYFLFDYYWSKGQELQQLSLKNEAVLAKYERLKEEYTTQKTYLEQNQLLKSSRTSFYADRLAESLPKHIRWLDLNICPLIKSSDFDEDAYKFNRGVIRIKGTCIRSSDLNDWIQKIDGFSWTKETTIMEYHQDNKGSAGEFLLQINLN